MIIETDDKGEDKARLRVKLFIEDHSAEFVVSHSILSKLMRNGTIDELKSEIRSRMTTKIFKEVEKELTAKINKQVDEEWKRVCEAFPEPLPLIDDKELVKRVVKRRCSRQMTAAELAEMREKLLADLEGLK